MSKLAIEHCGHLPQEEQPEAVNRLLLDFLDGWAGRTVERIRRERPTRVEIGQEKFFPSGQCSIRID